jgi:hypothetical protein
MPERLAVAAVVAGHRRLDDAEAIAVRAVGSVIRA